MKTLELAKKAAKRIEIAITEEQFKKWSATQQRKWIKDHPTSKFAKKPISSKKPRVGDDLTNDEIKLRQKEAKDNLNKLSKGKGSEGKRYLDLIKNAKYSEEKINKEIEKRRNMEIKIVKKALDKNPKADKRYINHWTKYLQKLENLAPGNSLHKEFKKDAITHLNLKKLDKELNKDSSKSKRK